jgi:3-(3-hydroxy-phenyl)propionate hydroxylase
MAVSKEQTDVLIVGFGPVGATIANLLGAYGVRTLVVDKATDIFMAPRAIALDNEALRILQLAGLPEDAFERIAIPYVRMRSPYFGEFARINSAGDIDGHPKLVTFYQPELERALRETLASYANVRTLLGVELIGFSQDEVGVTAQLRGADGADITVAAKYLIGADGAGSRVRALIGQEFKGSTYAQDWLIVDAKHVPRPIDHIEFLCDPKRPTPHMVAPGDRERWEFMLRANETREEMERDATIHELLRPWGRAEDMHIERKAVYRFHARCADCFQNGRVFLAGDAAHITPPFAGQGLVAGLRDAANLSWKLAWVLNGRSSPGVLGSYDVERRPHAKAMIGLAKFLGRLIMPSNTATAILVHGFIRLLRFIPSQRAYFDDLGIKPQNTFRNGLFVRGASRARIVRGGLLPQGWVRDASGATCLSDDVLGASLTLIGFGADPSAHLDAATARAFAAAGGRIVRIGHRGQRASAQKDAPEKGALTPFQCSDPVFEDLNSALVPGFAPVGWAAIVRPDRAVLHDGPVAEVDSLVRESLELLGAATFGAHASSVPV